MGSIRSGWHWRVFCHVKDAVDAMIGLMDDERAYGQDYNICGIEEISMRDLADKVCTLTKSSSDVVLVPYDDAYAPPALRT